MFISIPREFFVPVVFGEGFILNEKNNNLELDTNIYRESTGNNSVDESVKINYLKESKSSKEKQDIISEKIEMNENKCDNIVGESITNKTTNQNQEQKINKENISYMSLNGEKVLQNACKNYGEIFKELDDEFVQNIDIKVCSEKK